MFVTTLAVNFKNQTEITYKHINAHLDILKTSKNRQLLLSRPREISDGEMAQIDRKMEVDNVIISSERHWAALNDSQDSPERLTGNTVQWQIFEPVMKKKLITKITKNLLANEHQQLKMSAAYKQRILHRALDKNYVISDLLIEIS